MSETLRKIVLLPLWPFRPVVALLQPRAHTTAALRRVLYTTCILGVLGSFFAGIWSLAQVGSMLPLKELFKTSPEEHWLWISIVVSVVPYVFMAVLQGSSAYRVLRHVPDRVLLDVPGLAAMNGVARVCYGALALAIGLLCLNACALVMVVLGALVALVLSILFSLFYVVVWVASFGAISDTLPFTSTVELIWNVCTFARYLFHLEASLQQMINIDPNWLGWAGIVLGYAVPTLLAVVVWVHREKFLSVGESTGASRTAQEGGA